MRLSDEDGRLTPTESMLPGVLESVRRSLGTDVCEYAGVLDVSEDEYNRILQGRGKLSAHSALKLSARANVSFEKLLQGDIDLKVLTQIGQGNLQAMPDRYTKMAKSRKRTSINILEFLERFHGRAARDRVLRNFQVSEGVFESPDEWINVLFLSDMCEYLGRSGYSPEQLYCMGSYSVVTNFDSELGRQYRRLAANAQDVYRRFEEALIRFYDENFWYRLVKSTPHFCLIEAEPNSDVEDELKLRKIGNPAYCVTKAGAFASFTGYLGLPFAKVKEISCIHRGDRACRYLINYEHAAAVDTVADSQGNIAF